MLDVRPFRALRYDPATVGDLSAVVAPPYDVIDDALQRDLYERSPYNAVRLVLGRETDRYAAAATALVEWQRCGALVRDATPALYVYGQDFALAGGRRRRRTGIIAAVRLQPFSSGVIRPHEKTLSAPKADRMRLIQACQANLSPIFGIHPERPAAMDEAIRSVESEPAAVDVRDDAGVRHRMWPLAEPRRVEAVRAGFEKQIVLIADGHHRYETALAYRDLMGRGAPLAADDPINFVMMFLCAMTDPGLVILPTHRVLRALPEFDGAAFLRDLQSCFALREFPVTDVGRTDLLAALGAATAPGSFGISVRGADRLHLASLSDRSVMDKEGADLAPAVRRLDVAILDRLVVRKLAGEAAGAAQQGRLLYVKDAGEALDLVRRGDADVASILNPTRIEEIRAACEAGETMPEKSTYFYPKLLTGLTIHPLRDLVAPVAVKRRAER